MIFNKSGTGILILAMLVGMALVPAVNGQIENNYSVSVDKAFEHANARMISFIASDPDFEEWKGASIDPKPLELYDINGKKLFYQFSVYKNNEMVGRIKVCADKTLGQSVQSLESNPKPFNATETMKKSIEIAKNEYPDGKIKSTIMTVYSYPSIGAMTIVKDRTTGEEYRIFVDAYTLEEVQDKPATETELGVWSMYDQILKNGKDNNLKKWQESDQFTKFIEQEATDREINISVPIIEEKMTKLSDDAAIKGIITSKTIYVPLYGQENDYYCAPASAKMIAAYYYVSHSQDYIYGMMGPTYGSGGTVYASNQLQYYTSTNGLNKPSSVYTTSSLTFNNAVSEINSNKPFKSGVSGHARVCKGYSYDIYGGQYLKLNNPWPVGSGNANYVEGPGLEINRIYVR